MLCICIEKGGGDQTLSEEGYLEEYKGVLALGLGEGEKEVGKWGRRRQFIVIIVITLIPLSNFVASIKRTLMHICKPTTSSI